MTMYNCKACGWPFRARVEDVGKGLDSKDWYSVPRGINDRCPVCGLMTVVKLEGDDLLWYERVSTNNEEEEK